jgi:predicted acetyltransferase
VAAIRPNDQLMTIGQHALLYRARRGLSVMKEGWWRTRANVIERALITCDDGNEASRRAILANGGVLEDVREGKERYWIAVG